MSVDGRDLGRWGNPTIAGELVTLRPLAPDDLEPMLEMLADPEGNDLTATPPGGFTRERIVEWIATRADADERIDVAIVENATGEYAGEAVLNEFDAATNGCNFRIALRGPRWYGRGLGTEATELLVAHGLGAVGLDTVTLTVLARNPRAQAAYRRAGFAVVDEYDEQADDGGAAERWVVMEHRADTRRA